MDSLGSNLELFQQVAAGVRDSLSGAWYSGDTEGTSFWAHRLAGSSRIVGLTRLADAANGIERLIRRGAPNEDVHAAIGNLLELYGTSAEALAQWLNQSRFITKDASAAIQREPATGAAE
jgi:HPt (histidine-containing phosphotransfer) domain-containing protein